ncbi:MAG: type II toxin-antitoxin system VapC family toxin [Leptospiraceae bacterium]|nr:type II toxin-antitoxin system VapC family toxin [Leptospiraceae bacterium]
MRYIFDTNIILHVMRNSETWKKVDAQFNFSNPENKIYISIVSEAEIYSLARQLNWGNPKIEQLEKILSNWTTLYINKSLVKHYVEIDTYSQGKHPTIKLPKNISARNMGKNDIWIAATTILAEAELLTTDKDFDHLDKQFLKVHYIQ